MNRRYAVAGIGAVTALAVAALVAIFTTPVGTPPPPAKPSVTAGTTAASLTHVIPAHPVTAITTPAGPAWWTFITRMAPTTGLAKVNVADAGVRTTGYAYSTSAVRTKDVAATVPTYAAAYVQTTAVDDANTLVTWLATQPGADHRRAYRSGLTVIIGPEWADPTEFTLDTTSTTAALAAGAGKETTTATWTWDLGQWRTTATARAKDAKAAEAITAATTATGITDHTSITVTATSPDGPWTGTVQGYDAKAVDLAALSLAYANSDQIVSEQPYGKGTTLSVIAPGLSALRHNGGVTTYRDGKAAPPVGNVTPTNLLGTSTSPSVAAVLDTHLVTDYALGYTTENTGPAAIHFQMAADGTAALAPVFTTK